MPHRTLNLEEVARYLHLNRDDVERLVKDQDIPFERHGGRLVFRKIEIDSWASPRILGLNNRRLAAFHEKSSAGMKVVLPYKRILPDLIEPSFIDPALPAKTKASVLREIVNLAEKTCRVWDRESLLKGLEAREELCSTGLTGGLALLHTRQPEAYLFESVFLVLGRTVQEIPFGAPDGRATDLFFLVACPDGGLHLLVLARLCLLARKTEMLARLRCANTSEEMHTALLESEQELLA